MNAKVKIPTAEAEQRTTIKNYYRLHAKIYDSTRWTFLFGRKTLLRSLPFPKDQELHILEVGCGTGTNLKWLAQKYPKASLTGMDLSADMIKKAQSKMRTYQERTCLVENAYGADSTSLPGQYDLILFSYCLTMVNPFWETLIRQARTDLKEGGYIAVSDFEEANFSWYRKFMEKNHVRMQRHLTPLLTELFQTRILVVKKAYFGVWTYFNFIGLKKTS